MTTQANGNDENSDHEQQPGASTMTEGKYVLSAAYHHGKRYNVVNMSVSDGIMLVVVTPAGEITIMVDGDNVGISVPEDQDMAEIHYEGGGVSDLLFAMDAAVDTVIAPDSDDDAAPAAGRAHESEGTR